MPNPIVIPGANSRAISIKIPARAAYDLKSMNRITETVLGRLGCPECHSGFDLRFEWIEDFIVDEELNVDSLTHGKHFG